MYLIYINSLCRFIFLYFNSLIFNYNYNLNLVYSFILSYRSNFIICKSSQKNRSLVSHSTRKIYKQKGTGRARAGMTSSPIRRGGGRSFPNFSFENFSYKFNKKMYKKVLCIIYSQLLKENRLFVVEDFFFIKPSTNYLWTKLKKIRLSGNFVFLSFSFEKNFFLSSRNLNNICLMHFSKLNPIILLKFSNILVSNSSLFFLNKFYG